MFNVPPNADLEQIRTILQQLSNKVARIEEQIVLNSSGWSEVSNVTETKTFDADSTTLAEVADAVGTIQKALISARILR